MADNTYMQQKIEGDGVAPVSQKRALDIGMQDIIRQMPEHLPQPYIGRVDPRTDSSLGDISFVSPEHIENKRYENQSGFNRITRGLVNAGVIAGTTLLDMTFGNLATVLSGLNSDNSWRRAFNRWQEHSNEKRSIYRPTGYDEQSTWSKLGSSVFWGDLIQNSGYTTGMLAGSAPLAAIPGLGATAGMILTSVLGAMSEAGTEALNAGDDLRNERGLLLADAYNRLYKEADTPEKKKALDEWMFRKVNEAESDVNAVKNLVMATNAGLLMASNMIGWGPFMKRGFNFTKKQLINNAKKKGLDLVTKDGKSLSISGPKKWLNDLGIKKADIPEATLDNIRVKTSSKTASTLKNLGKRLYEVGNEGAEEVAQGIISDYAVRRPEVSDFSLLGNDPVAADGVDYGLNGIWRVIKDAFQDKNTAIEALMGSFTSLIGVPGVSMHRNKAGKVRPGVSWNGQVGEFIEKQRENARVRKVAEEINKNLENGKYSKVMRNVIRTNALSNRKMQAANTGDEFNFKNYQFAELLSTLDTFDALGHPEVLDNYAKTLQDMSDEELLETAKSFETSTGTGTFINTDGSVNAEAVRTKINENIEEFDKYKEEYYRIKDDLESSMPALSAEARGNYLYGKMQINDWLERRSQLASEIYTLYNDIYKAQNYSKPYMSLEEFTDNILHNKEFRKNFKNSLSLVPGLEPSDYNNIIRKVNDIAKINSGIDKFSTELHKIWDKPEQYQAELDEEEAKTRETRRLQALDETATKFAQDYMKAEYPVTAFIFDLEQGATPESRLTPDEAYATILKLADENAGTAANDLAEELVLAYDIMRNTTGMLLLGDNPVTTEDKVKEIFNKVTSQNIVTAAEFSNILFSAIESTLTPEEYAKFQKRLADLKKANGIVGKDEGGTATGSTGTASSGTNKYNDYTDDEIFDKLNEQTDVADAIPGWDKYTADQLRQILPLFDSGLISKDKPFTGNLDDYAVGGTKGTEDTGNIDDTDSSDEGDTGSEGTEGKEGTDTKGGGTKEDTSRRGRRGRKGVKEPVVMEPLAEGEVADYDVVPFTGTPGAAPTSAVSTTDIEIEGISEVDGKATSYADKVGDNSFSDTSAEDAFSVNRMGCVYNIDELKQHKAVDSEIDSWGRAVMLKAGLEEFMRKGYLREWIKSRRAKKQPLTVHYVSLVNYDSHDGKLIERQKKTVFACIDSPHGNISVIDQTGKPHTMQIIGVVYKTNDPVSRKNFQILQDKIYNFLEGRKYLKSGTVAVMAPYTSELEFTFSGRFLRNEDGKKNDLISIMPKKEDGSIDTSDAQIVIYTDRNVIEIGKPLDGNVIPLNRFADNPRSGLIWLRVLEGNGQVTHKAINLKRFSPEEYPLDIDRNWNSPVVKRIRAITEELAKPGANIKGLLSELHTLLYIPEERRIVVIPKKGTFRIGNSKEEYTIDKLLVKIFQEGYRFNVGSGNFTLQELIESNIFQTDLSALYNVGASFLIGQTVFNEDGSFEVVHSKVAEGIDIHTGKRSYDPAKTSRIAYIDDEKFEKTGAGEYTRLGKTHEQLTDLEKELVDLYFKIQSGFVQPDLYWKTRKKLNALRWEFNDGVTRFIAVVHSGSGIKLHVLNEAESAEFLATMKKRMPKKATGKKTETKIRIGRRSIPAKWFGSTYYSRTPEFVIELSEQDGEPAFNISEVKNTEEYETKENSLLKIVKVKKNDSDSLYVLVPDIMKKQALTSIFNNPELLGEIYTMRGELDENGKPKKGTIPVVVEPAYMRRTEEGLEQLKDKDGNPVLGVIEWRTIENVSEDWAAREKKEKEDTTDSKESDDTPRPFRRRGSSADVFMQWAESVGNSKRTSTDTVDPGEVPDKSRKGASVPQATASDPLGILGDVEVPEGSERHEETLTAEDLESITRTRDKALDVFTRDNFSLRNEMETLKGYGITGKKPIDLVENIMKSLNPSGRESLERMIDNGASGTDIWKFIENQLHCQK